MTKSHTDATLRTLVNQLVEFTGHVDDPEFLRLAREAGVVSPDDFMRGIAQTIRHIRAHYLAQPGAAKPACVLAFDRTRRKP